MPAYDPTNVPRRRSATPPRPSRTTRGFGTLDITVAFILTAFGRVGRSVAAHRPQFTRALAGDGSLPALDALSDRELKTLIGDLAEHERAVSYERRILHGKIDLLRAELMNRWREGDDGLAI